MKPKSLFPALALAIFILLVALVTPRHTQAQNINWVALQGDATAINVPGQIVMVTLDSSINVPITGVGMKLHYDPACFRVISHHPGSLLPGAVAFIQAQAGQFDLTYAFHGGGQGRTGSGSLIAIQLEALKLCASDISVAANTILLGVLDAKGMAANLPGVEYRTLKLHLVPGQAPAITKASVPPLPSAVAQQSQVDATPIFFLMLILIPVLGVIGYFLLRRHSQRTGMISPIFGMLPGEKSPALIYAGRSIPLPEDGTTLGRHIRIIQRDGCFYIMDTGSQNGTFVNGRPVGEGYYLLHDGDDVQLSREVSYRFVERHRRITQSS